MLLYCCGCCDILCTEMSVAALTCWQTSKPNNYKKMNIKTQIWIIVCCFKWSDLSVTCFFVTLWLLYFYFSVRFLCHITVFPPKSMTLTRPYRVPCGAKVNICQAPLTVEEKKLKCCLTQCQSFQSSTDFPPPTEDWSRARLSMKVGFHCG